MLQMSNGANNKSLGELFSDFTRELSTLLRQEVQLAKTEVTQNVSKLAKSAIFMVAGGVVAWLALHALIAAAILGLISSGMSGWLAALVVGGILLLLGGILAFMGISALKKANLAPKETIQTLKEDARWAREQVTTH
jgi:ABC-type multidrug transport system fused ATPase/permease subunit